MSNDKDQFIMLKVSNQRHAQALEFFVSKEMPIKTFEGTYKQRAGIELSENQKLRFIFDGKMIGDNDTPSSLGMEDSDTIDAVIQTDRHPAPKEESGYIYLKVELQGSNSFQRFKVTMQTPMKKLMKSYCERTNTDKKSIRFHFDGYPIYDEDTPTTLEMVDGDMIEVNIEANGGN